MSTSSDAIPGSEPEAGASRAGRWRVFLPAAAFLGGFGWDVVTLGRRITSIDLVILIVYFVAAAAILVLIGRRVEFRGSTRLNLVLQFLFGGIFSALVVLYFMSSGAILSFVVVLGLAGMLVTNEFLGERYHRLSVSWAVFGVCGVMLLNFVLPHIMRSIQPVWFYASLAVATGLVVVLKRVSHDEDAVVWPTLVAACLLALLQMSDLIPPVPLAARAMVVGSELRKENGNFIVSGEAISGGWMRKRTLVRTAGGPIYCLTSVFIPPGIETKITHRWMKLDPGTGDWNTTDRIAFRIAGGRPEGYRGYTVKKNVTDGEWKVVAESEAGDPIASTRFTLASGTPDDGRRFERRY
jgi:hypothetical protein